MLSLSTEFGLEGHLFWSRGLLGGAVRQTPDTAAAIAVFALWAYWVARLEGKVWLDVVDGRIVVVFDLT